jgi:hypothetical protein
MLALLAANPYLGIEDPNMRYFYYFFAGAVILFLALLILRGAARLRERHHEKQSAWKTFYQLSKARGLNKEQVRALALVARQARVKRPAQVLGSIQAFDQAVYQTQRRVMLTDTQQILLDSVRKKLVTTKERWTGAEKERRHLERAHCAWSARCRFISREEVAKELLKVGGDDDAKIKEVIERQLEGEEPQSVQIVDISAGGVALRAGDAFSGGAGDFGILTGESERIPFDINGLCGEVRSVEEVADQSACLLHCRFLPFDRELRRQIIQFVYARQEKEKRRKKRPAVPSPPPAS